MPIATFNDDLTSVSGKDYDIVTVSYNGEGVIEFLTATHTEGVADALEILIINGEYRHNVEKKD